jgi:arylsulfatase A-like enzyme
MKIRLIIPFFLTVSLFCVDRPNILWITAEDMSPVLGCYGDPDANTPNIDALAKQSVRYTNAFASAPVCSPSRSCLIQGCYPTTLGTQQMRSGFPLPPYMKGFPSLLRKKGYFSSNNVKTDYNSGNYEDIIKSFFCVQLNDFPPEPNNGLALCTLSKGNSVKIVF